MTHFEKYVTIFCSHGMSVQDPFNVYYLCSKGKNLMKKNVVLFLFLFK